MRKEKDMYGKIIDGNLVTAPNPMFTNITDEDTEKSARYRVFNPTNEQYETEGYLEIVETDYPDTDKYYEKRYIERDGKIYGEWVEAEAPEVPEPTPTADERIAALEEELRAAKILLGVE